MITGFLILALASISIIRRNENRYNILVFASLCGLFQIMSDDLSESSGFAYYLGAAIIDLLIIVVISKSVKITKTTIDLQRIALCFVYANLAGFVIYELYYPPFIYNYLCLALFISALVVAVKKGGSSDLGDITNFGNDFAIYRGYNTCNPQMQLNKKKA